MILPSEVHIAARNKNPKLVKVSIPGSTKSVTFLFTQLVDYYVTEVTFVCTNLQRDFIIIHVLAEKKIKCNAMRGRCSNYIARIDHISSITIL